MRRTPFVLLVVFLLGSGLIALLLLNSSLNQGSFELTRLQRKTTELTDEQQALQQEVDQLAAPDALERRARELGLVPGGSPAFLGLDGTVHGVPAPAPPAGGTPAADPAAYVSAAVPNPAVVPGPAAAAGTAPSRGAAPDAQGAPAAQNPALPPQPQRPGAPAQNTAAPNGPDPAYPPNPQPQQPPAGPGLPPPPAGAGPAPRTPSTLPGSPGR
ncbi:septum formation initiator family protein [Streptomyces sp. AV19]|nr:septum formation initiator family protein [Streptomyces sp. AV19]MBH1936247.1 septum formation initiator family protein [Streptomyces sp. AV19]MDG4532282.1 septum formation initiator family protein [Streptomyces sp. AV19]